MGFGTASRGVVCACAILSGCVLVQTRTNEKIITKTEVPPAAPYQHTEEDWSLEYASASSDHLRFVINRLTIATSGTTRTYRLRGTREREISRDNTGQFKFYFFGPAWVTEDSGGSDYAQQLAMSTCLSLGVGLIFAGFDWLTLPLRVIDTDFEEEQRENEVKNKQTARTRETGFDAVEWEANLYPVRDGVVEFPRELFFKRNPVYGASIPYFKFRRPDGETVGRNQPMRVLFGGDAALFERLRAGRGQSEIP